MCSPKVGWVGLGRDTNQGQIEAGPAVLEKGIGRRKKHGCAEHTARRYYHVSQRSPSACNRRHKMLVCQPEAILRSLSAAGPQYGQVPITLPSQKLDKQ